MYTISLAGHLSARSLVSAEAHPEALAESQAAPSPQPTGSAISAFISEKGAHPILSGLASDQPAPAGDAKSAALLSVANAYGGVGADLNVKQQQLRLDAIMRKVSELLPKFMELVGEDQRVQPEDAAAMKQTFEQTLEAELNKAGINLDQAKVMELIDGMAKGGTAGMVLALYLVTSLAEVEGNLATQGTSTSRDQPTGQDGTSQAATDASLTRDTFVAKLSDIADKAEAYANASADLEGYFSRVFDSPNNAGGNAQRDLLTALLGSDTTMDGAVLNGIGISADQLQTAALLPWPLANDFLLKVLANQFQAKIDALGK